MSAIYETDQILAEYLLFHYGSQEEILPIAQQWPVGMLDALDFAVRTPGHFSTNEVARGLDLGCAVGRSAFEMSKACREVLGIDFSHAFIHAAEALRKGENFTYERREEAGLTTPFSARIPEGAQPGRVKFSQGDAMHLPEDLGSFDRVHAANLLCRLPEPKRLLARLPGLVNPSGELVLATPCTWLEVFTPRENWPSGGTFEWLRAMLEQNFTLLRQVDEPFLIRETARKFQWTRSMVTVWRRHA